MFINVYFLITAIDGYMFYFTNMLFHSEIIIQLNKNTIPFKCLSTLQMFYIPVSGEQFKQNLKKSIVIWLFQMIYHMKLLLCTHKQTLKGGVAMLEQLCQMSMQGYKVSTIILLFYHVFDVIKNICIEVDIYII